MRELNRLLQVFDRLLGPGGCPFDRAQTVKTLRGDILEEVHELLEAIDLDDNAKIREEMGDVMSCLVLLGKVAEKEGRFSLADSLQEVGDKMVRRHPHVFADQQELTEDQLNEQWDRIKREEKGGYVPESILDGIVSTLPALARSQVVAKRVRERDVAIKPEVAKDPESQIGERLFKLVEEAEEAGVDAEVALRHYLARKERRIREIESALQGVA